MVKAEVQKTDTEKVIEEEKVHLKGQKETTFLAEAALIEINFVQSKITNKIKPRS